MGQSVTCPTLGFGSGHDLTVREFQPHTGLRADSAEPAWDSLTPSLCPSLALSLSLSQNKQINKNFKKKFVHFAEHSRNKLLTIQGFMYPIVFTNTPHIIYSSQTPSTKNGILKVWGKWW